MAANLIRLERFGPFTYSTEILRRKTLCKVLLKSIAIAHTRVNEHVVDIHKYPKVTGYRSLIQLEKTRAFNLYIAWK